MGVSAVTGAGCDDLFAAIDEAAAEYHTVYKPALEAKIQVHWRQGARTMDGDGTMEAGAGRDVGA